MLNLNGGLTKANIPYSTLWSRRFDDDFFKSNLRQWLQKGYIRHDETHVRDLALPAVPEQARELARSIVAQMHKKKVILGVFDEGSALFLFLFTDIDEYTFGHFFIHCHRNAICFSLCLFTAAWACITP